MCAAQEAVEVAEIAEIPAKLRKQRRQLEIQVAHEPGIVREIRFEGPSNDPNGTKLDDLIILTWERSNKPIYLIRSLDSIPVCSGETSGSDDGSRRQRVSEGGGNCGGGDVMYVDRAVRGSSHNISFREDLDCVCGLRVHSPPSHRASVHSACGDDAIPPGEVEA